MASPHARRTGAVVVPLKGFAKAKERLSPAIDAASRALLAQLTAEAVVRSALALPDVTKVVVVTDDESSATWARNLGAECLIETSGLNPSVELGYRHVGDSVDWVMICHADLVHPERLAALPSPGDHQAIVVRDRHREGTNVLILPAGTTFEFHYGPGSAEAHREECTKRGLRPAEVIDALLGIDVDTPADLGALPAHLRERIGL